MSKRLTATTSIRPVPRVVCMMRVKNEARWIKESIESVLPLCAVVLVFDDHSTDRTREIVRGTPKTQIIPSPFTGWDESRDKNFLLGMALMRFPDWILCIDGDEVLEEGGAEFLRENLTQPIDAVHQGMSFPVAFCWGSPFMVRVDREFGKFSRVSLFRPDVDHGFRQTDPPRNLHCGNAPSSISTLITHVRIKHYGYMLPEDRQRKLDEGLAYPPPDAKGMVLEPWVPGNFSGVNQFDIFKSIKKGKGAGNG